ncbi:MAG: hypothetical protein LBL60_01245 [Mycoplasmataceae bacterium]|nr:hypothetical protein [Mycoplasmataceae bacterium]
MKLRRDAIKFKKVSKLIKHYFKSNYFLNETIEDYDSKLKIPTYIVLLLSQYCNLNQEDVLQALINNNFFKIFKNEINQDHYDMSINVVIIFLSQQKKIIDQNIWKSLITDIFNIFKINYLIDYMPISIIKTLKNDYENNVQKIIIQQKYLTNIHKLLREILPSNMCMLAVLMNQMLEKIG